jgi:hypothetical protein
MTDIGVRALGAKTRDDVRRTSDEVRLVIRASLVHFGDEMTPTTFNA